MDDEDGSGHRALQPGIDDVLALARDAEPDHPAWTAGAVWLAAEADVRELTPDAPEGSHGPWQIDYDDLHPTDGPGVVRTHDWLAQLMAHGPDWIDVRAHDTGSADLDLVLVLVISNRSGPPRNGQSVLAGLIEVHPSRRRIEIIDHPASPPLADPKGRLEDR